MLKKITGIIFIFIVVSSCVTGSNTNNSTTYKSEQEALEATRQKEEEDKAIKETIKEQEQKTLIKPVEVAVEVPIQIFEQSTSGKSDNRTPQEIIADQLKKSTQQVNSGNFEYSTIAYNFLDGIIYPIYTTLSKITVIELKEGELLLSSKVGDSLNWGLENETINKKVLIYVKPFLDKISTNLFLFTNERRYIINLVSNNQYMPLVRWNYGLQVDSVYSQMGIYNPNYFNNQVAATQTNPAQQSNTKTKTPEQVQQEKNRQTYERQDDLMMLNALMSVNFGYKVQYKSTRGYRPKWYPEKVFDDGFRTYIYVPGLDRAPTRPVCFGSDIKGKEFRVVNYVVRGKYYIINSIEPRLILTTERDNKIETVYIVKNY